MAGNVLLILLRYSSESPPLAPLFFSFSLFSPPFFLFFSPNFSPMYIAEISPAAMRGLCLAKSANHVLAFCFPFLSFLLPFFSSETHGNGQIAWRWMFGLTAIPSLYFFSSLPFFSLPFDEKGRPQRGAPFNGEAYAKPPLGRD